MSIEQLLSGLFCPITGIRIAENNTKRDRDREAERWRNNYEKRTGKKLNKRVKNPIYKQEPEVKKEKVKKEPKPRKKQAWPKGYRSEYYKNYYAANKERKHQYYIQQKIKAIEGKY